MTLIELLKIMHADLISADRCKTCGNTAMSACDDCVKGSNYKWHREAEYNKTVKEYRGGKMRDTELKPCPFCGRKMVFHTNTYTNKYGKQVTEQYYMHEDYDINKEESCILDEIDMPFTLGAGDANPDNGYIGEYGEKWNRRAE